MGMTITERILAAHAGRTAVEPGEFVSARVDMVMGNDLSTAGALPVLREMGAGRVFDPERVAVVLDHLVPAKDIQAATLLRGVRAWVRAQGIRWFFDEGRAGIAHVVIPEQGLAAPGEVVIGGDSHSCTYGALGCFATGVGHTDLAGILALGEVWLKVPPSVRFVYHGEPGPFVMGKDLILLTLGRIGIDGARYQAMEFTGPAIGRLDMSERLTICNMAIEAGAKSGIVPPDEVTLAWIGPRARRPFALYHSDLNARYAAEHAFDVTGLRPQVARPSSPDNVVPVDEVAGTRLDQVFLGSCTNAKLEDLRIAARLLRGRKVHPETRLIDPAQVAAHIMEGLDPDFGRKARPGDLIVAGKNFGCGSSRETAPGGLKAFGIGGVIAVSFARIFLRNAVNIGLPILECPAAAGGIAEGDLVEVEPATGVIRNLSTGREYRAAPFPPFLQELMALGGLVPYVRRRLGLVGLEG